MIFLWNIIEPPYDYMIAPKYEILNMLPVNHMNEWEDYGMNEDDDEIMILKIYICYMCTIW